MVFMERNYIGDIIESKKEEKVVVKGWVYDSRELGKIRFMVVRDISGIIQVVGVKKEIGDELFELMNQSRESVIEIHGKTKLSKQAPGGIEMVPEKIVVLAVAEQPIPIDVSDF